MASCPPEISQRLRFIKFAQRPMTLTIAILTGCLSAIPKGLSPPRQGCEERGTLDCHAPHAQPQRGCAMGHTSKALPFQGRGSPGAFSQGGSFLATLGFVPESRWDSL